MLIGTPLEVNIAGKVKGDERASSNYRGTCRLATRAWRIWLTSSVAGNASLNLHIGSIMIVVHVGLKKSGSASIQTFFDENAKRLRKLSLDYPQIGRRTKKAHHNLAYEIQGSKKFDPRKGTLAESAQHWKQSTSRVMILSSEMFEEAEVHETHELKTKLLEARGSSEEFRIYIVIRDLVDLLPSSYAQKVKYGLHGYSFDSFFAARMQMRRVHYFDTVQRWAEAFGWENLQVRVLDPTYLLNGDLIDDLLGVCGVTAEADKRRLKRTGIQNAAPGWRVLEATRALSEGRHGLTETHPLRRRIERKLGDKEFGYKLGNCAENAGAMRNWNADRGRYLSRFQAQLCYHAYCNSVIQLNRRLSCELPLPLSLDERGFVERQFVPDVSLIPPHELQEFYDSLWELLANKDHGDHSQ
jgi:hypothetical protein